MGVVVGAVPGVGVGMEVGVSMGVGVVVDEVEAVRSKLIFCPVCQVAVCAAVCPPILNVIGVPSAYCLPGGGTIVMA